MMAPSGLAELESAATAAQAAETAFRENIASELARLERARQFAFRRVGLVRAMAYAVRGAESEEAALAAQAEALKAEFGWSSDSEERTRIVEAWQPVARALWANVAPAKVNETTEGAEAAMPPPSVPAALSEFEVWYRTAFGREFLALLDHEIPEIPVVEC